MTRELALAIMIAAAVVLLAAGAWGWWRRTRRDAGIRAPFGETPDGAETVAAFDGLYVATTRHDEPLERLAIRGLGFRSRVGMTVTDAGVALDLTGQPRVFFALDRLAAADRATVAIDRVVEKDGLVRLVWRTDDGSLVDTYLRAQNASSRTLADTITRTLPTPMGTDA
ncbi:hypothetical protein [Microbacterium sp.]|uniref:PH-like domain-containing protein n=1 Tax=Microbacterium sp. TaxID=51671 RepID=UPI003A86B6B4